MQECVPERLSLKHDLYAAIEVKREVPGHVANRLRAALWREAIHLVNEGVATVNDVDTAVAPAPAPAPAGPPCSPARRPRHRRDRSNAP